MHVALIAWLFPLKPHSLLLQAIISSQISDIVSVHVSLRSDQVVSSDVCSYVCTEWASAKHAYSHILPSLEEHDIVTLVSELCIIYNLNTS